MGADIHAFTERKVKQGVWTTDWPHELDIDRDYCLFGALAGVRGGDPFFKDCPRGLPEDVSLETLVEATWPIETTEDWPQSEEGKIAEIQLGPYRRALYDIADTHSFCWLTDTEALLICDYLNLPQEHPLRQWAECGYETERRVVFWFDN